MAEAAKEALGAESLRVVADAGCSNGEQAAGCELAGIIPHVPVKRAVNNQGGGAMFDRTEFRYQPETDTYLSLSGEQDYPPQTASPPRQGCYLSRGSSRLQRLCDEGPLHANLSAYPDPAAG